MQTIERRFIGLLRWNFFNFGMWSILPSNVSQDALALTNQHLLGVAVSRRKLDDASHSRQDSFKVCQVVFVDLEKLHVVNFVIDNLKRTF